MPLLKFRCKDCGRVFDTLVRADALDKVPCEACGGPTERAYEGRCHFGMAGSGAGRAACSGDCGSCGGCGSKQHGEGCACGACH